MWRRIIAHAYEPERLYARYTHQINATYVNRVTIPLRGKLKWANLRHTAILAFNLAIRVGLLSDYRLPFWRMVRHVLQRRQIAALFVIGFISHHLIQFTRESLRGAHNAALYKTRVRDPLDAPPWLEKLGASVQDVQ
jgi:hypothetical protein